jgi:Ca2+-dependent lipid-binding protein
MNIQKVDLGGIPARVGGMKVYSSRDANRKEIVMDAEVIYNGDAVVHFTLQGVPVEIKQIVFRGTARVTLKPILDTFPFVGGFEVSFVKPPLLDYKLGRLGTFAEVPAVSSIVKIIVEDQIGSRFVWPNRFRMLLPFESILQNTNVKKLLLRVPLGLMKVCVKRAKDLVAKDKRLGSSGTSDPYVIMSIGSQKWSFREKYVEKTLNPNFEYVTYLTFEDLGRHDMLFEVFDYDNSSSDDFMGKAALDLNQAIECQSFDKWLSLEEAKHGSINVVCKWRPVLAAEDDESRASGWHILSLLVESCSGLKTSSGKTPVVKCIASDSRGNVKFIDTKARSANPVFMESGTFQGGDIDTDCLTVNIVDAKSSDSFGAAKIPFKYLRSLPEMAFESKAWDLQGGTADDAIVVLSAKLYLLKD